MLDETLGYDCVRSDTDDKGDHELIRSIRSLEKDDLSVGKRLGRRIFQTLQGCLNALSASFAVAPFTKKPESLQPFNLNRVRGY